MTKVLKTEYLMVNSGDRRREPVYRFGKMIILPEQAVTIRTSPSGSSTVLLIDFSPELAEISMGDSIVLDNLVGKSAILSNPFSTSQGSLYLRVRHPDHGQNEGLQDDTRFERISIGGARGTSDDPTAALLEEEDFVASNPATQVMVEITAPGGLSPLGISARWFQESRRACLIYNKIDGRYQANPNYYLLRLDRPSPIRYFEGSNRLETKISVRFNSFYGLSMDLSGRSLGLDDSLVVSAVRQDSFIVETRVSSALKSPVKIEGQVILKKIIGIDPAYPENSNWIATLPRRFERVEKVRVISSIFPNSQRVIDSHNNELVWQMDQGNYRVRIPAGNYSPDELASQIARTMKEASPGTYFKVRIEPTTGEVSFAAMKKSREFSLEPVPERVDPGDAIYRLEKVRESWRLYRQGVLEMEQAILINWSGMMASANAPLLETFSYNHHLMLLQWPGQRLRVGDLIITDQFYDPSVDKQQYIYRVLDGSRPDGMIQLEPDELASLIYQGRKYTSFQAPVEIPDLRTAPLTTYQESFLDIFFNPGMVTEMRGMDRLELIDTFGNSRTGLIIRSEETYLRVRSETPAASVQAVELPLRMRLVMSNNSTLKTLGFKTSTDYHYLISQTSPNLQLSGENCLYLLSDTLSTIPISGNFRNIFQIINWYYPPGTVCYDAHTPLTKTFSPASELNTIDLQAVNPDGSPYQFNGLEYQLVLEIQHR